MSSIRVSMMALAVVLIMAAFVVVACEDRAEVPVQQPGTTIDIDVDRSKPRPKLTQPAPAAPAKKPMGRRK